MKNKFLVLFCFLLGFAVSSVYSQSSDYKVIVTTPGYTSIYRYDPEELTAGMKKDFRLDTASVELEQTHQDCVKVKLLLGRRTFDFNVTTESPIIRLNYDRNRRLFVPLGCNYVDTENVRYTLPTFNGLTPAKLPETWLPDIEKKIHDRNLLDEDEPNRFILEVQIDEAGTINKIEEIGGALKQYSQVFIDKVYDAAVRGWKPATRNGIPIATVAHLVFEIDR